MHGVVLESAWGMLQHSPFIMDIVVSIFSAALKLSGLLLSRPRLPLCFGVAAMPRSRSASRASARDREAESSATESMPEEYESEASEYGQSLRDFDLGMSRLRANARPMASPALAARAG